MADALLAQGTHLQRGDGATPEVFTTLAKIKSEIPFPALKRDVKEETDHDSPNQTKEFIGTLIDPGQVKVTISYLPGNTTHKQFITDVQNGDKHNYKIVMVDDDTSEWAFSGIAIGFEAKGKVDDAYEADCTIQVTGSVTPPN